MEPLVEYVERVDVWAATIEDKPGGLARVLAELREEGADLQFIISRRAEPGKGLPTVYQAHFWLSKQGSNSVRFLSMAHAT